MFLNGAGSKGARLRGFPRIVAAAADGGISLTSFDGEGEEGDVEGEEGRADRQTDRRDWHQEMMMMMGGRGERRNKKLQMNSLAEQSYDHGSRNIM